MNKVDGFEGESWAGGRMASRFDDTPIVPGSLAAEDSGEADREILVVDPGVDEPSVLVHGRRPGIEVLYLRAGGRGLEQIAEFVAGRCGIEALHLLCHGEPGALVLAGERVDLPALAVRPGVLEDIARSFHDDARVLLYGCSVASGAEGLMFLDFLEARLGVGVAASAGPVGAATLGGRWTLRDRYGTPVETAFSMLSRAVYPALLTSGVRRWRRRSGS